VYGEYVLDAVIFHEYDFRLRHVSIRPMILSFRLEFNLITERYYL